MSAPISDGPTQWLIQLLGAERAAQFSRPLTDAELAAVDESLARHSGDPVAAMGVCVDDSTAAIIRALPIGGRR